MIHFGPTASEDQHASLQGAPVPAATVSKFGVPRIIPELDDLMRAAWILEDIVGALHKPMHNLPSIVDAKTLEAADRLVASLRPDELAVGPEWWAPRPGWVPSDVPLYQHVPFRFVVIEDAAVGSLAGVLRAVRPGGDAELNTALERLQALLTLDWTPAVVRLYSAFRTSGPGDFYLSEADEVDYEQAVNLVHAAWNPHDPMQRRLY